MDAAREDRVIGSSLEAAVVLSANAELYSLLARHSSELAGWFIVSQVELRKEADERLKVSVERARGDKCERCWKFTMDVGSDPEFPTVCASCASVLPEIL